MLIAVRMPGVLTAMMTGGLFHRPDMPGASAGACFVAAVAILLSMSVGGVRAGHFLYGTAAVVVTWSTITRFGKPGTGCSSSSRQA